jgi:hypothetical protein
MQCEVEVSRGTAGGELPISPVIYSLLAYSFQVAARHTATGINSWESARNCQISITRNLGKLCSPSYIQDLGYIPWKSINPFYFSLTFEALSQVMTATIQVRSRQLLQFNPSPSCNKPCSKDHKELRTLVTRECRY